jgi:predicted negative regulator of RcsB-dependent stress response
MDSKAPPSAGFYDILGWFETNKKQVAIGAVAVVFVGLVVGFWVWQNSQQAVEAEEALALVRMPFSPLEAPQPGTAAALEKVAQEYPETPAAAKALLRAGTVYFGDGNYAKAREQFDAYLRSPGETPWVPQAVFGVAASLDAENKVPEAIAKYKDFIERYSGDPAADQARLNLARLYEATGQAQQALEILSKMMSPQQGGSPSAAEAQERIKGLITKFPSLMPTNAAPTPQAQAQPLRTDRPLVLKPEETSLPPETPKPSFTIRTNAPTNAPRVILNPNQPTPAPLVPPQNPTPGAANPPPRTGK